VMASIQEHAERVNLTGDRQLSEAAAFATREKTTT